MQSDIGRTKRPWASSTPSILASHKASGLATNSIPSDPHLLHVLLIFASFQDDKVYFILLFSVLSCWICGCRCPA